MIPAGRVAARALTLTLVTVAWLAPVSPGAQARACEEMTGLLTVTGGRTEALVTLPDSLRGRSVPLASVSVTRGTREIPVTSIGPVPADLVDVVLVVDTSAAAAEFGAGLGQAARALLAGLPPQVSAAVVTAGGTPAVTHRLAPDPATAVPAATPGDFTGAAALRDAVWLAVQALPLDPVRQQQVVVLAAGGDRGSRLGWSPVQSLLTRRGVALDVLDLAGTPSLPQAGEQCPGGVAAAGAGGAATTLATTIMDRRRLVLEAVPPVAPAQVTVTLAAGTATATIQGRGEAAVPAVKIRRTAPQGVGVGTLLLAFVLGLGAVGLVLLLVLWRTKRGREARRALRAVLHAVRLRFGERRVADNARRVPRAEGRRRLADAWHDLDAVTSGTATARDLAEADAHVEALARAADAASRTAFDQRMAARDRAVQRRDHAIKRAQEIMAVERVRRERLLLSADELALPLDPVTGEVISPVVNPTPEQLLSAQLAQLTVAEARRAGAERAAAEALLMARVEQEAAEEARRTRALEAEAAAEATSSADGPGQGLAADAPAEVEPVEVEVEPAEVEVEPAEVEVEVEPAEVEVEPAEVEVEVEVEAVEVEVEPVALEPVEVEPAEVEPAEVELADAAALASTQSEDIDLRPQPADVVMAAISRGSYVTVPLSVPSARTPLAGRPGTGSSDGAPGTGGPDGRGGAGSGGGPLDRPDPELVLAPGNSSDEGQPTDATDLAEDMEIAEHVEDGQQVGVDMHLEETERLAGADWRPDPVLPPDSPVHPVAQVPPASPGRADQHPGAVRAGRPNDREKTDRTGLTATHVPLLDWVSRAAMILALPLAAAVKTWVAGGWWEDLGAGRGALLAGAVTLAMIGCVWLWIATEPPRALRRHYADLVQQAVETEVGRVNEAEVLLGRIRDDHVAHQAWSDFEAITGLTVPGTTRTVISADMDPGVLVRYLVARQQEAPPRPQTLPVVASVPFALLMLPAVALLAVL